MVFIEFAQSVCVSYVGVYTCSTTRHVAQRHSRSINTCVLCERGGCSSLQLAWHVVFVWKSSLSSSSTHPCVWMGLVLVTRATTEFDDELSCLSFKNETRVFFPGCKTNIIVKMRGKKSRSLNCKSYKGCGITNKALSENIFV